MDYTKEEESLIWLSCFDVSYGRQKELINKLGLVDLIDKIDSKVARDILEDSFDKVLENADTRFLESYLKALEKQGVVCLTLKSKNYPEKLKNIENPPFVIFAKGDLSLLNKTSVGVVGSRTPTNYGRVVTEKFAIEIAKAGVVIVSGLAFGVDSVAHSAAIKASGKTIAVLGGGFNNIYPSNNDGLANEISEKGLLISEYRPSFKPTRYSFPQRNRIIAALSEGILITEAAQKSGSLHTKNFAIEYGKEVFVVPGNITSAKSAGSNNIIRSMQGSCVLEPSDILEKLGVKFNVKVRGEAQLSMTEEIVIKALDEGEKGLDELTELTNLSINNLVSHLTMLEIRGIIKKLPGNLYMKLED